MPEVTTIKVTRALRDRLAEKARRDHLTLGAVIEAALDEAESRSFWDAVAKEHAALTPQQRAAYVPDSTVSDHLDGDGDTEISLRGDW